MENSVVLIAQSNLFNVRIVENGVSSEKQFRVHAFAASWAEGQALRLGVPVVHEMAPVGNGAGALGNDGRLPL
nr:hypothetical protein REQ54_00446 [Rhizobium sp. Q54]